MKIQAFGCTHGFHHDIKIDDSCDMLIHTGDESNYRMSALNYHEAINFLEWYGSLPNKYKIFVAGNHSTAIEKRLITKKDIESLGIIYLEDSEIEIEGINIYGSPCTPKYGDWAFMRDRAKMDKAWIHIPENTNILITHGPPYGILDLSENRERELEMVGCKRLLHYVKQIKPKYHFFSHIHNKGYIQNRGIKIQEEISFCNVNCVEDGRFDKGLQSSGLIVNYND